MINHVNAEMNSLNKIYSTSSASITYLRTVYQIPEKHAKKSKTRNYARNNESLHFSRFPEQPEKISSIQN